MQRYLRPTVAALALLVLVAGAAFAAPGQKGLDHRNPAATSHQPSESEPAESESQDADASQAEQSDETQQSDTSDGNGPSDQLLDRIVENFSNEGVDTDADTVKALAEQYGVGGAVRILSWADAAGVDPSEITDLFDSGMGWGQIRQQINADHEDANVSPGIGHVMSGGTGHGNTGDHGNSADAPGQNK